MSKFVKTAIAAAMVMGVFTSTATIAAGNNGTARFYGTIEDSVCSIVPDDHKLEVDMGDIGGNDSNLLIVFYVQIMPDDFVMQLHRF